MKTHPHTHLLQMDTYSKWKSTKKQSMMNKLPEWCESLPMCLCFSTPSCFPFPLFSVIFLSLLFRVQISVFGWERIIWIQFICQLLLAVGVPSKGQRKNDCRIVSIVFISSSRHLCSSMKSLYSVHCICTRCSRADGRYTWHSNFFPLALLFSTFLASLYRVPTEIYTVSLNPMALMVPFVSIRLSRFFLRNIFARKFSLWKLLTHTTTVFVFHFLFLPIQFLFVYFYSIFSLSISDRSIVTICWTELQPTLTLPSKPFHQIILIWSETSLQLLQLDLLANQQRTNSIKQSLHTGSTCFDI